MCRHTAGRTHSLRGALGPQYVVAEAEEQREAELRAEEAGGVAHQSERALVDSHSECLLMSTEFIGLMVH